MANKRAVLPGFGKNCSVSAPAISARIYPGDGWPHSAPKAVKDFT
jgi:hypothetical protein